MLLDLQSWKTTLKRHGSERTDDEETVKMQQSSGGRLLTQLKYRRNVTRVFSAQGTHLALNQ